jgi:hypothetical protein
LWLFIFSEQQHETKKWVASMAEQRRRASNSRPRPSTDSVLRPSTLSEIQDVKKQIERMQASIDLLLARLPPQSDVSANAPPRAHTRADKADDEEPKSAPPTVRQRGSLVSGEETWSPVGAKSAAEWVRYFSASRNSFFRVNIKTGDGASDIPITMDGLQRHAAAMIVCLLAVSDLGIGSAEPAMGEVSAASLDGRDDQATATAAAAAGATATKAAG